MTLQLTSFARKFVVACAALVATGALALPLWAQFQVARYSAMGTQESLERALTLHPYSAEFHNRMGRLLLYTPLADTQRARQELELAAQLDPRSGQFWMDLAMFHEIQGDFTAASQAIAKARAAEPRTPAVLWFEANYLVRRGMERAALDRLKVLLADSPEYTVRALAFFAKVAEPGILIERALPHRRESLEAAMEFIRAQNLLSPARQLWNAARDLNEAPSPGQLRPFVDWLLNSQQVALAQEVWRDCAQRNWLPIQPTGAAEPIYNAGFESPIENFGFDWHVVPHPEASTWIEARGPAAGLQSLCVQFGDDSRSAYEHIGHAIPVEPNSTYVLKASLRSDQLISRSGAALVLRGSDNSEMARTDSVMGTTAWREVTTIVKTGDQARLLWLRFSRPAPAKNEDPARGLACFSDVRWIPSGSSDTGGRPQA